MVMLLLKNMCAIGADTTEFILRGRNVKKLLAREDVLRQQENMLKITFVLNNVQ